MSDLFELHTLLEAVKRKHPYYEFLRISSMSVGIYALPAGSIDRQQPHKEDEIYFVVRGKAKMQLGGETRPIKEGDVIFVEPALEHRFFDIELDLVLLVVFAPAETS